MRAICDILYRQKYLWKWREKDILGQGRRVEVCKTGMEAHDEMEKV